METFWMVYRENGSSPRVAHTLERLAEEEAQRLSKNELGVKFFILEAKRYVLCSPMYEWNKLICGNNQVAR